MTASDQRHLLSAWQPAFLTLALASLTGCDAARDYVRGEAEQAATEKVEEMRAEYESRIAELDREVQTQREEREAVIGFVVMGLTIIGAITATLLIGRAVLRTHFAAILRRGPTNPRRVL